MRPEKVPRATYRLQLHQDFGFAEAAALVPYLHRLGISHVYTSPYLRARSGSPHGYDIVDHEALNPELGERADYERFLEALRAHDMGQILDIVPNHMGVGGSDNAWWLDVLEHGPASPYAHYFDIDWQPVKRELRETLLLPFLGDHYGIVLERGELELCFDARLGSFHVRYYEHRFPFDPRSYAELLGHVLELEGAAGLESRSRERLAAVMAACRAIPRRNQLSQRRRRERREASQACKARLAELCTEDGVTLAVIERALAQLNGVPGDPASFNRLHGLLERQAYRLAYWQVAADEINYRRFFDINALAGIRVEDEEVFARTHRLIGELVEGCEIDGLRVDHPDGLSDPAGYYRRLQRHLSGDEAPSFYLLAEKILARHERLPSGWAIHGTTGYEFAAALNGLFVDPAGEVPLDRLYRRFTGRRTDFDELLYERKKLIIRGMLSSELTVLANLLSSIAESDRTTRDFTYQGLREALIELVACFPVYRTYIDANGPDEADRQHVKWAAAQARRRNPASDVLIYDFIERLLLGRDAQKRRSGPHRRVLGFIRRLQQYTAPVMAKGMEDTAFYIFNRLISLNDVGFDPRIFTTSPTGFHQSNLQRLAEWPDGMLTTSTHDSKRGEDVRARINTLSEIPELWRQHLGRWQRINRRRKKLVHERPAPTANDEYLLYQTLIGSWPIAGDDTAMIADYRERIREYMIKAVKEAKLHTSWINPDAEYETAVRHFVDTLLDDSGHNAFLADFLPLKRRLQRFGLYTALSQALLKLTAPGVPDIYQGNELWCFNLTDPDNRRAVDFERRAALLEELIEQATEGDPAALATKLLHHVEDGRAKLYLSRAALELRRRQPALFRYGDYVPLTTGGTQGAHLCAFSRQIESERLIVAAPRWFARLLEAGEELPLGEAVWHDACIELPGAVHEQRFRNVFTGRRVTPRPSEGASIIDAAELFADFTPALLVQEAQLA